MRASFAFVLVVAGCGSSSSPEPDAASLRPGVEDSSEVYKGTPSANETAFWTAVRDADDAGRAAAVAQLQADVTADPSNGYSDFLIGASHFMPPRALLAALAAGQPIPPGGGGPDPAAAPFLANGLAHLTDPFYLGFDGGLLASLQLASGDPAGAQTMQTAIANNHAATSFIAVLFDLQMQNTAKALDDMYALFEFCNGAPLARDGSAAAAYAAKMAAGSLRHRECYSGFFAPHGSPGELFIMADLHALNGQPAAATAYYNAIANAPDAGAWPLAPLLSRRLAGTQAADLGTTSLVASGCGTCHTNSL